jgi:hypothetical protein
VDALGKHGEANKTRELSVYRAHAEPALQHAVDRVAARTPGALQLLSAALEALGPGPRDTGVRFALRLLLDQQAQGGVPLDFATVAGVLSAAHLQRGTASWLLDASVAASPRAVSLLSQQLLQEHDVAPADPRTIATLATIADDHGALARALELSAEDARMATGPASTAVAAAINARAPRNLMALLRDGRFGGQAVPAFRAMLHADAEPVLAVAPSPTALNILLQARGRTGSLLVPPIARRAALRAILDGL